MNKDTKSRDTNIMFLLLVCCVLLLWGVFGSTYDWFTGAKLVVLMSLGSMFGRLAGKEDNPLAKYLVYGSAAGALVVGMHLLPPYFWAARAVGIPYLVAYVITALIAWAYLYKALWQEHILGKAYHAFTFLPIIIFASSLLAANIFRGTLYASTLLSLFYLVLAICLLIEGVKGLQRTKFNGGFLLLAAVFFSFRITFLFKAPEIQYIYASMVLLFVLNFLFTRLKRKGKNQ
ncbi:MAG: hypothetical protein PHH31_01925 [Acidaminococcaceae bacterium]|nr:hypothetical protein [Acidaminococcaceae bacterium]